jgi:hypothetical protein
VQLKTAAMRSHELQARGSHGSNEHSTTRLINLILPNQLTLTKALLL